MCAWINHRLTSWLANDPDLVVSQARGPDRFGTGQPVMITNTLSNVGIGAADYSYLEFFLLTNAAQTTGGILLGAIRPVWWLPPGQSSTETTTVWIPADLQPGRYWLKVVADSTNRIAEANEQNNTLVAHAVDVVIGPDLVVSQARGLDRFGTR